MEWGNNFASPESLQNEVAGEGKDRLLSFKKFPDPSSIFMPSAPASECNSRYAIDFSRQSSGNNVSGFKNKMYLPVASFSAILLALENPIFSLFHINFTLLNLSLKKSLLSSEELLSTTNTSVFMFPTAFITEHKHCSKKYFTL